MAVKGILVGCLLIVCWVAVTSFPLHASCKLTWTFSVSCDVVHGKIIKQMQIWNMDAPCGTTEKCGYAITSDTDATIKGTHTTPVHKYVDDLTMDFFSIGFFGCSVKGFSTSEIFYAILDEGTNYCNLHNLVAGSGLTNTTRYGFKEDTDDSKCTEYSSADCSKY